MSIQDTVDLFKVVVVGHVHHEIDTSLVEYGYVLTFHPTKDQANALMKKGRDRNIITLFSAKEARKSSLIEKIEKQFYSYASSYFFDSPYLLVEHEGKTLTLNVISSVTVDQLKELVDAILYANKPAKDVQKVANVINDYGLDFDFNSIKNNELRIALYDERKHKFTSGDDAVRYIVWKTTGQTLLIKNKEVLSNVKLNAKNVSSTFLKQNDVVLSQVFNRHKDIILSLKVKDAANPWKKLEKLKAPRESRSSLVNKIARLSKSNHVPLVPSRKATIVSKYDLEAVKLLTVREKFRLLNHVHYIQIGAPAIFTIRNGKLWFDKNYKMNLTQNQLDFLLVKLLDTLENDLSPLRKKVIMLPKNIDYGLPVSQKQAFGNLPWGTTVSTKNRLSSGIFWRESWGASDLDLSTLDMNGNRIGWGRYSGYSSQNDILFSGDLVNAPDPTGAMEFMTSQSSVYGLYVNVFSGGAAACDVVVGDTVEGKWIKNPIIQEHVQLPSRGAILGFVNGKEIILFSAMINNRISTLTGNGSWSLNKRHSFYWTTKKLLTTLDIPFVLEHNAGEFRKDAERVDLTYGGFTYDKLEKLFFN